MTWFRRTQRPNRFVELLMQQAELTTRGLGMLEHYMAEPSHELAIRIKEVEEEADEVRRILIDELNRSFVTPFDREDIFALSLTIDDMLDYAWTTVDEMEIFGIQPTEDMVRLVELLHAAAREIWRGVQRLEHHPRVANEHAVRAKALENRVEREYRRALARLFQTPRTLEDVVTMLKYREVYRHLSNAADRGDEAANVIGDIVVKWL